MMQMKHVYQDWDKKCALELGLKMYSRTGIKHMHWNWDLACVWGFPPATWPSAVSAMA